MTSDKKKLPFTQLMVSIMPKKPGTYTLWNKKGQVIFIGAANKPNSLHNELKHHFENEHSISIDGIYDFQVEVCNDPGRQQIKHLENFKKSYGYLPDYNEERSLSSNKEGSAYSQFE